MIRVIRDAGDRGRTGESLFHAELQRHNGRVGFRVVVVVHDRRRCLRLDPVARPELEIEFRPARFRPYRESPETAMQSDWSLSRYDVLPDRIVL